MKPSERMQQLVREEMAAKGLAGGLGYQQAWANVKASEEGAALIAQMANAGTSEGVKKGWEHRSKMAGEATKLAQIASSYADESGDHQAHSLAESAFRHAAKAHLDASDAIDEYQNEHGYDKEMAAKGAQHRSRFHGHNDFANKLNQRAQQARTEQAN